MGGLKDAPLLLPTRQIRSLTSRRKAAFVFLADCAGDRSALYESAPAVMNEDGADALDECCASRKSFQADADHFFRIRDHINDPGSDKSHVGAA